jgi:hypothetical protein
MGRTLNTYRNRLILLREHLSAKLKNHIDKNAYHKIWEKVHNYAAPASTFPHGDTFLVSTYCILLELNRELIKLENDVEEKIMELF